MSYLIHGIVIVEESFFFQKQSLKRKKNIRSKIHLCSILDLEIQSRIKSGTIWHNLGLFYPRLFCESRIDLRLILDYIWVYNLISYLG